MAERSVDVDSIILMAVFTFCRKCSPDAMEQIGSIFSRIKQQMGGTGDSRVQNTRPQQNLQEFPGLDPHTAPEEDGFLVVGETASERTTVKAVSFDIHGHQAPPTYDQVGNAISFS